MVNWSVNLYERDNLSVKSLEYQVCYVCIVREKLKTTAFIDSNIIKCSDINFLLLPVSLLTTKDTQIESDFDNGLNA